MAAPSPYGIRFTPEMARGLAREAIRNELSDRYEISPERQDEVIEMVARRMMEAVHALDNAETQIVAERLAKTGLQIIAREKHSERGISTEHAQMLATDLLPLVPRWRELMRNIGQDLRPMLTMKHQLRLAADLAMKIRNTDLRIRETLLYGPKK